ncbi:ABC transporter permease [Actinokineospora sp. NBRC 105648]|uniref:ABC transporter permease n=1 Tax=Actinokineospora sp. NBRC 105648 TaxID=3032206 RepID=UPI0024A025D0|nr:ABC transporter permease [Actinokineospora sp. NBRC 105648]GLZ38269.1 hypothetical protein Acsp05_18930 [Actinokineospora sp. NBRC 105648]
MRAWLNDLAIGVRLAVGGGRTPMARFLLSTLGIAIAVAVLLLASSVSTVVHARDSRAAAGMADSRQIEGVAPTTYMPASTQWHEIEVLELFVAGTGPNSPVPRGIPRLPAADEIYVSPALAATLADPDNGLLRERFPQRIAGVIDADTIVDPRQHLLYGGIGALQPESPMLVYAFGNAPVFEHDMDPGLLLLLLLGTVALLVPVFIFLAASTRIAGAERDRRLSALRLVGADGRQVRRIAAAETLVSACAGLVLGWALFLGGRELATGVTLMGISVPPQDIRPIWWLAVLVVLAIPALALSTAQFALRGTIIEPLGVVRRAKPVRRRISWRLAVVALGVVLLLWRGGVGAGYQLWAYAIAAGATLLLLGVPILLPWVVERAVGRLRGGPTSWQLAIRRLQLDSGTSARVVGGVAVVLAGAIALQSLLLSEATHYQVPTQIETLDRSLMSVYVEQGGTPRAREALAPVPGVTVASDPRRLTTWSADGVELGMLVVADCDYLVLAFDLRDCADGQVFRDRDARVQEFPAAGSRVRVDTGADHTFAQASEFAVPTTARPLPATQFDYQVRPGDLIVTAGALPGGRALPAAPDNLKVRFDPADRDAPERVRNALQPLRWLTSTWTSTHSAPLTRNQDSYLTIRRGLLIGSVFTLLLAGVSLLVLALEHIRERRRPLAVLAAGGVPGGVLARSLLWQIAVPIGLGAVVAVVTGVGLASLVIGETLGPMVVDWSGVVVMTGAAAGLGVLVSVLTLPFLRSATRLNSLRTE